MCHDFLSCYAMLSQGPVPLLTFEDATLVPRVVNASTPPASSAGLWVVQQLAAPLPAGWRCELSAEEAGVAAEEVSKPPAAASKPAAAASAPAAAAGGAHAPRSYYRFEDAADPTVDSAGTLPLMPAARPQPSPPRNAVAACSMPAPRAVAARQHASASRPQAVGRRGAHAAEPGGGRAGGRLRAVRRRRVDGQREPAAATVRAQPAGGHPSPPAAAPAAPPPPARCPPLA